MNIATAFAEGRIYSNGGTTSAQTLDFNPHVTFKGVSLKHLVKGDATQQQISCHLVKVEPFCVLEEHVHTTNTEIHEVIGGSGVCCLEGGELEYAVGTVSVIPANAAHKVTAGAEGLYILAKFTPALL